MLKYVECPGLPRGISYSSNAGDRIAIRPLGLLQAKAAAAATRNALARPLAGGPITFAACEVFLGRGDTVHHCVSSVSDLEAWERREGGGLSEAVNGEMERLTGPRTGFAGLARHRPSVFGIVNVTPDSFHDGGRHGDTRSAIAHGEALIEAGADAIDIGGESTRPGADETSEEAELTRVLPVIQALRGKGAVLSIDTRRARVMDAALDAGAEVVNDISALLDDPDAINVVADRDASVILMHMQGRPRTMQDEPRYGHAPYEIRRFLDDRVRACKEAGISAGRIAVDPGIGFGKNDTHNLQLLSSATMLHGTGAQIMVGASRKSFIGRIFEDVPSDARLPGSLAAATMAVMQGVQLLRVHDVMETRQALAVIEGCLADGPV